MTGQSLYYLGEYGPGPQGAGHRGGRRRRAGLLRAEAVAVRGRVVDRVDRARTPPLVGLTTHEYRVTGPAAIFLTTTAIDVDEELLNRCVVFTVDEDRDQTRAIHDRQRRARTLEGIIAGNERAAVLKQHQDAQRLLEPVDGGEPVRRPARLRRRRHPDPTRSRQVSDVDRRHRAVAPAPAHPPHRHHRGRPRRSPTSRRPWPTSRWPTASPTRPSAAASTSCRRRPAGCWTPSTPWSPGSRRTRRSTGTGCGSPAATPASGWGGATPS